jgi:hypothetical protein
LGSFKHSEDSYYSNYNLKFYSIYPNPTVGNVSIDFLNLESGEVVVKDLLGQQIARLNFIRRKTITLEIDGAPGWYLFEIRTPSQLSIEKVFKY